MTGTIDAVSRLLSRLLAVVAGVVIGSLVGHTPVHAHTDFDFSLPTDGASVGNPVDEITVAFTLPVTLVGNGFEVLDPQGNIIEPFAVTDDDTVFRLQLDPPLAGGDVGVRYAVRAEDGHELTGAFSFTVDAPMPTTSPPTTPPPTTPATAAGTSPATAAATTTPSSAPPTSPAPVTSVTSVTSVSSVASASDPAPELATADDGGGLGVWLIVAGAGIVGVAGFFLVRSRSSAGV